MDRLYMCDHAKIEITRRSMTKRKKFFEDEKSPMICRVLNDPSFSLKADSTVRNLILQDEKENEPPTVEPKVVEFPQSPQNDNKQIC